MYKKWSVLVLATAVLTAAVLAGTGNPNPQVLPPASHPYGQTYGEWGAAWWQWALAIPMAQSPVADTTGENAAIGQSGPMWFLAGTFGGPPVVRECTIPTGKGLYLPLANYFVFYPAPDETVDDLRTLAAESNDVLAAEGVLTCAIDGVELKDLLTYRATDPYPDGFSVVLPDDNMWADYGITAGTYAPCVCDGYAVIWAPLSAGTHTIQLYAFRPAYRSAYLSDYYGYDIWIDAFTVDVTYHLTIEH
jgi:hypothetical protein